MAPSVGRKESHLVRTPAAATLRCCGVCRWRHLTATAWTAEAAAVAVWVLVAPSGGVGEFAVADVGESVVVAADAAAVK